MTEEEIREKLRLMELDPGLKTESAYRANAVLWPDNLISFIENHAMYLRVHPKVNPEHYLSNLRLMIKIRG
ncbi:hypothetical protein HYS01_02735 [Candidatus Saccharibacteria bacterium]|nr:hypothetical protein [Candidatus Saccharibacteria bacterium]